MLFSSDKAAPSEPDKDSSEQNSQSKNSLPLSQSFKQNSNVKVDGNANGDSIELNNNNFSSNIIYGEL